MLAWQASEGDGKGRKRVREAREDRARVPSSFASLFISYTPALLLTLSLPFYSLPRRPEATRRFSKTKMRL